MVFKPAVSFSLPRSLIIILIMCSSCKAYIVRLQELPFRAAGATLQHSRLLCSYIPTSENINTHHSYTHPTTLLIHSYISTHHSYTHQYTPVQKYILYQYISIHYSYTIYTPVQQYILQHPTLYHTAPWSCTIYHSAHCLHFIGKPFLGLWPKLWGVGVKSPNFCFLSTLHSYPQLFSENTNSVTYFDVYVAYLTK